MTPNTEDKTHEGPTRREYLRYSGGVVTGGLLAGCADQSGSGSTPTSTADEADTATPTDTDTETATPEDGPYTVSLAPVGDVTFESPPESAFTVVPWYADMAYALGHGDSINSMWYSGGFDDIMNYFLSALPDASVDWASLDGSYGATKEQLYELGSDVHFVDPAWLSTQDGWDEGDIKEIAENVAPWFGNQYSNLHLTPPDGWSDRYEYYTLWELFEKIAAVYRERARYEALAEIHANLLDRIEDGRPQKSERPTVGYVQIPTDLSAIYVLRLNAPGYYNSHTRPLGAVDAFADTEISGEFAAVDFEALLEADPDVLLTLWGMTSQVDFEALKANLSDHDVGRELSAVQNDRVYTQGTRFQGPLMNLFQLEMTAKQLYPDAFGAWPGYEEGSDYPHFDADERLFDHERVQNIINGDF
jgi:ABC-type Fe3+-hydroxamate transport system substrate-binding protein